MPQSFFVWNGRDCRSMGIMQNGSVPIVRPEERVQHVEIPGRSGDLTELEGESIYNSYIQTASITVRGGQNVRNIYRWLRGSGYVTFSGEPDRRQPARIIGAITLNKHSHNMDCWSGEVQFYCQPLKELLTEQEITVGSLGASARNNGDVIEEPDWIFTATASTARIDAGGKSLTMTGLTSGQTYIVRSDVYMVLTANLQTDLTAGSSGDFPVLLPGNNTIGGTGWNSLTIRRKERYL